ncbi:MULTISPECIES: cation-transporting P-type ATPase [Enterococcus]|uniref:Cation-transporting P-type ATPase N-terminal domain-containing protein n=1 Tax=Enterococcus durans TaxID=53345 RepID=A0A367CG63_9ENTE|nr:MULTISPECIES: cation-transporting P-type ATPase [Enterococcus]MDB1678625.1 cation-transporting P-type ATPase [Enterococcus durans]RCA11554.1 hypothetical protein EA71_02319 [Enterococcus durans]
MKNIHWDELTNHEAQKKLQQFGKNRLEEKKKESFFLKIIHIILEPMFLLLIIAAFIYFFLGEPHDGLITLVFVVVIIVIDSIVFVGIPIFAASSIL